MTAKELRIGNLVTVDNKKHHPELLGKTMVVCGLEKLRKDEGAKIQLNHLNDDDNVTLPACSQFEKFVKGISLTGEWLEYFGFINGVGNEWTNYNGDLVDSLEESIVIESSPDNEIYWYTAGEGTYLSKPFSYVHELQNLHFALTGKELNTKELWEN